MKELKSRHGLKKLILVLSLFLLILTVFVEGADAADNSYRLAMAQPSALNVVGAENEVQGFSQYGNDLYIGYYSANSNPNKDISSLYQWDGNVETPYYTFGYGADFNGIGALQEFGGNLFAGNQTGYGGANSGCVYEHNPNSPVTNFIQMTSVGQGTAATNSSITIPSDSINNAIYGSTSYSVEYYGRIDDLGMNSAGVIIRDINAANTSGFQLRLNTGNTIEASIIQGGTNKATITNNKFNLGNFHDIIFSWTLGNYPIIYIDGIAASLASSTYVTTPSNDDGNTVYLGNSATLNNSFGGTFNRLRIWRNYAISPSDALTLATGSTISTLPTGQYLFTEGSGTTTADSSGNGNNGSIASPAFWNNSTFTTSYCSGNDRFIYSFAEFKGNLYAGAGYSASRVYSYNGTTW